MMSLSVIHHFSLPICTACVISFVGLLALAASLPLSEHEEQEPWAPHILYPNRYTLRNRVLLNLSREATRYLL
ncbi:hypothetical protein L210DRAFT_3572653 [Boletus edulis BED1]|uniref:Uncharacterized protein n=1 Tax=Boletus edulis BED1 TaxID=1328754 RepID=A0AAD4G6F3_BOLED|nr:hypothetical protein L210DRAFT_3572653 [Boletus edulis BED1]